MSQVSTPQLMDLPREIRNSIWDFSTKGPVHYKMPKACALLPLRCRYYHPAHTTETVRHKYSSTPYEDDYPLFFVSKQIRRESLKIFYNSPFTLEVSDVCPNWPPHLAPAARRCLLRHTILFKTLFTSVTIHNDILSILYDNFIFTGCHKLRHVVIDLGTLDLLCPCEGQLCAQGKKITLPEVLHTMSKALPLWKLTPEWAPSVKTKFLYEGWKMRAIQIRVKAKIRFIEEGHERRLVSQREIVCFVVAI